MVDFFDHHFGFLLDHIRNSDLFIMLLVRYLLLLSE